LEFHKIKGARHVEFYPEAGGSKFFRIVGDHVPNYTMLHPTRRKLCYTKLMQSRRKDLPAMKIHIRKLYWRCGCKSVTNADRKSVAPRSRRMLAKLKISDGYDKDKALSFLRELF
jgi:hypothetical protein